jgi:hypothetical protein
MFVINQLSPHQTSNSAPGVRAPQFGNVWYIVGIAILQHTMAAHARGGIAPTHSLPWHWMGVSGQRHASAELYHWEKDPPSTHCTRDCVN